LVFPIDFIHYTIMPYYSNRRRNYGRRRFSNRRKGTQRVRIIPSYRRIQRREIIRAAPRINDVGRKLGRLVYCTSVNRGLVNQKINGYTFRINSLYDPDYTGTGHRPFGTNEYSQMFNHYTVLGAKYTIIVNAAPTETLPFDDEPIMIFAGITAGNSIQETAPEAMKECGLFQYRVSVDTGENWVKPAKFVGYWSAKKYFNVDSAKDDIDNYGAAFGNNPVEQAFLQIGLSTANDGAPTGVTTSPYQFEVRIEFICAFSEAKQIAMSN